MAKHEGVMSAAAEMSQSCREQQVEEEDWSSFMCSDGTAFGRHEEIILNVSDVRMNVKSCSDGCSNEGRRQQISIQCVSALSPLDMIDMYNGSQDALYRQSSMDRGVTFPGGICSHFAHGRECSM